MVARSRRLSPALFRNVSMVRSYANKPTYFGNYFDLIGCGSVLVDNRQRVIASDRPMRYGGNDEMEFGGSAI